MPSTIDRFASNLRDAYERSEYNSIREVERGVWSLLGNDAPTHETIRAYLNGRITEHRVNLQLVVALCVLFGAKLEDLSPELAFEAERFQDLLLRAMSDLRWAELCDQAVEYLRIIDEARRR